MGEIENQEQNESKLARGHKDGMFRAIFSEPKKTLELYGAIVGKKYAPDTKIEYTTIEEVLYDSLKNDISFKIEDRFVVLIEHQSTVNENMAIRHLIYYVDMLKKTDKVSKKELYRRKATKIAEPEFIVLYNGLEEERDYWQIELKNNFKENQKNALNLVVNVYNINEGRNKELQKACDDLKGYAYYISKVRELKQNDRLSDREIRRLNQSCIEKGILKDFLEKHGVEVYDMIYEPLTEEERKEIYTEDGISIGYDKGRKSGLAEGRKSGLAEGEAKGKREEQLEIARKLKKEGADKDFISRITGLDTEEIERL